MKKKKRRRVKTFQITRSTPSVSCMTRRMMRMRTMMMMPSKRFMMHLNISHCPVQYRAHPPAMINGAQNQRSIQDVNSWKIPSVVLSCCLMMIHGWARKLSDPQKHQDSKRQTDCKPWNLQTTNLSKSARLVYKAWFHHLLWCRHEPIALTLWHVIHFTTFITLARYVQALLAFFASISILYIIAMYHYPYNAHSFTPHTVDQRICMYPKTTHLTALITADVPRLVTFNAHFISHPHTPKHRGWSERDRVLSPNGQFFHQKSFLPPS